MRRKFHSQMPVNSLHDRGRDRLLRSRLGGSGDKDRIRVLAGDCRHNLITISMETFGEPRRDLVLELDVVLGLIKAEYDERRLAASLRPVQMVFEVQGGGDSPSAAVYGGESLSRWHSAYR